MKRREERARFGALLFHFRRYRLLIVAFALSLLIHVIVASGMRWSFAPSEEHVQTVRIEHLRTIRISRLPTPPFTPPPVTPAPRKTVAATERPAAPKRKPGSGNAPPAGGAHHAIAAATAAPTPHPHPTSTCSGVETAAAIVVKPTPPADIAPAVRGHATSGTTKVRVTLDASGDVTGTAVAQSSGNDSLDYLALEMAKSAKYTPATHFCKAVASEYLFSAKFVAW